MALDLTAEQKDQGRRNFSNAAGDLARGEMGRRGFMKSLAAGAAVVPVSAAVYFGYEQLHGKPVKAALIGCGDEGGVLMGEHNPQFVQFVAACDPRPFNKDRILNGDPKVALRKGFIKHYGKDYTKDIGEKHFYADYKEMLQKEPEIEMVVIATPLFTHAPIAIDCMKAGKHVLCEKLMARTIGACKDMIKAAQDNGVLLSIGHQRHYSMLYAHAREVVEAGVLGDIKHIRALWHRNNSWPYVEEKGSRPLAVGVKQPDLRDGWYPPIYQDDYEALKDPDTLKKYGFDSVEQFIRWRLYDRTGGGLMAELGSHQLDAASIFLGKVKPLAVQGVGGKFFYGPGKNDREGDDGVFVTYEFPGQRHPQGPNGGGKDKDDIVVVTYSSMNTNGFEKYGECLMGSRATLIVESEQDVYLFKEAQPGKKDESDPRKTNVAVTSTAGGKPAAEASSTWGGPAGAVVKGESSGPVSRGYREEMEHFAWCMRAWGKDKVSYEKDAAGKFKHAAKLPRCHGEVAMADAILALTANMAMDKKTRIDYDLAWFDGSRPEVPETKFGKGAQVA